MTEVRTKLLKDLIEEGFEIVETEGADNGPCEVCILHEDNWTGRVIDERVIYSIQFQIEPSNSEP